MVGETAVGVCPAILPSKYVSGFVISRSVNVVRTSFPSLEVVPFESIGKSVNTACPYVPSTGSTSSAISPLLYWLGLVAQ